MWYLLLKCYVWKAKDDLLKLLELEHTNAARVNHLVSDLIEFIQAAYLVLCDIDDIQKLPRTIMNMQASIIRSLPLPSCQTAQNWFSLENGHGLWLLQKLCDLLLWLVLDFHLKENSQGYMTIHEQTEHFKIVWQFTSFLLSSLFCSCWTSHIAVL